MDPRGLSDILAVWVFEPPFLAIRGSYVIAVRDVFIEMVSGTNTTPLSCGDQSLSFRSTLSFLYQTRDKAK